MEYLAQTFEAASDTVALAAIALASTTVLGIIWVAKYFAKELSKDLKAHTQAAVQQREASLKSAEASEDLKRTVQKVGDQAELSAKNSEEQLKFMKALNGKLAKATIQTVQEQNVTHQTIQHSNKE